MENNLSTSFSDAFGSLEDVDISDMPDANEQNTDDDQSLSIDDFKSMAMNMAKNMKPGQANNLRNQVQNMPIDIGTIKLMIQMRQFAALRMLLQDKQNDPNLENAIETILNSATDTSPKEQIQIGQLITSLGIQTFHERAQSLLDQAMLALKKSKSSKSVRLRARREKLRKERMTKKKKK